MQNNKPELIEFTVEEMKNITYKIEILLKELNATFVVNPIINPNGTLAAQLQVFKIAPIVSPIQDVTDGESKTTNPTTA